MKLQVIKALKLATLAIAIVSFIYMSSCGSDNSNVVAQSMEVKFGFKPSKTDHNGRTKSIIKPTSVIVTVANGQGEIVLNREELQLYSFGESLLSVPVSLTIGDYTLTEFLVLDGPQVVYVSPIEGSEKAYLADDPLTIDFTVSENNITTVTPEVLEVDEGSASEDYGYGQFGFDVVETLDMVLSVFVAGSTNFELTDAQMNIEGLNENDDSIWNQTIQLLASANKLEIREASSYSITISKSGYSDWSDQFEITEDPHVMEIILEESSTSTYQLDWNKSYGGSVDESQILSIPALDDGTIVTFHSFSNDDIPPVYYSSNVMKVDNDGNIVWLQDSYHGTRSIVHSKNLDGYIALVNTGGINAIQATKLDLNGNPLWKKVVYDQPDSEPNKLIQTNSGYIISGVKNDRTQYGVYDYFLLEISDNGEVIWHTLIKGLGKRIVDMVHLANDQTICIGYDASIINGTYDYSYHMFKLDANGNVLWTKNYSHYDRPRPLRLISWGNGFGLFIDSEINIFDNEANFEKSYDFTNEFGPNFIFTDAIKSVNNSIVFAGRIGESRDEYDAILGELDNNFNIVFSNSYGGDSTDEIYQVHENSDEIIGVGKTIALAGEQVDRSKWNFDVWVMKLTR